MEETSSPSAPPFPADRRARPSPNPRPTIRPAPAASLPRRRLCALHPQTCASPTATARGMQATGNAAAAALTGATGRAGEDPGAVACDTNSNGSSHGPRCVERPCHRHDHPAGTAGAIAIRHRDGCSQIPASTVVSSDGERLRSDPTRHQTVCGWHRSVADFIEAITAARRQHRDDISLPSHVGVSGRSSAGVAFRVFDDRPCPESDRGANVVACSAHGSAPNHALLGETRLPVGPVTGPCGIRSTRASKTLWSSRAAGCRAERACSSARSAAPTSPRVAARRCPACACASGVRASATVTPRRTPVTTVGSARTASSHDGAGATAPVTSDF